MFSTLIENELRFIPTCREEGELFWSSVTLEFDKIFLQVTYQKATVPELQRTILLLTAEQLERLNHYDEVEIVEVNLASPGYLNKTGKWLLEPLSKIYVGFEPEEHLQEAFIYQMDDGQKYIDSALDTEEKNIRKIHCIFDKKATS